jgi:hypothetical protein
MLRIKIQPILHTVPVWLILLLSAAGIREKEPFFDFLQTKLDEYNEDFQVEKTYLMTDRYVYRPGEDLWFKGFVTSSSGNNRINSQDYYIRLLNHRGEEIIYRRYPLNGNETSGHLNIPKSCIPGKYWLIAYSGWMKNRCPEEAYRKEILISKYFEKRFQVEMLFDKIEYFPGDTLIVQLRITDPAGKPVTETPFDFSVGSIDKTDLKGSGKTDVKGKARISCVLPVSGNMQMMTIEIRSRKLSGDYSQIIPVLTNKAAISFFPEGGNLVAGISCNMVVKSLNHLGFPESISGVITDYSGNIIQEIKTGQDGLGTFNYLPPMDTCFLVISDQGGVSQKVPLPAAQKSGSVISHLFTANDTARFSIRSTGSESQMTYWAGVLNGRIVWSEKINFSGSGYAEIPLNNLSMGILQVSVFDPQYHLIGERLINTHKKAELLNVKLDRQVYKTRQRVSFIVEYPAIFKNRDLSLSISLKSLSHNDYARDFNKAILSDSCENEYKHDRNITDPELITSGYQRVDWTKILSGSTSKEPYSAHDGLTGTVLDKKDNVSPHAKVRVTHFPNFRLYETQSDENGIFHVLFGSDVIDYKFLNIDAYDALGKVNLNPMVDYQYIKDMETMLLHESERNEFQSVLDLKKYGEPDLVYVLRYGPGKFRKSRTDIRKKYDPYQYAKYTDVLDIIQDIQPYKLVNNKILFTGRDRNKLDSAMMDEAIIVINGSIRGNDINALNNILPSDITNINISTSLLDVHKYTPLNFNGVIEITTIQGLYRYRQPHVQIGPGALNAERAFYSPDYSLESTYAADNRRTLYWNPNITLFEGNSMLVTFYTSDIKGTYYGHLAGVDSEGNPIQGEFTFRVE